MTLAADILAALDAPLTETEIAVRTRAAGHANKREATAHYVDVVETLLSLADGCYVVHQGSMWRRSTREEREAWACADLDGRLA